MSVWNDARELVDSGISIFPLGGDDGKQPLFKWNEYRTRLATEEELDEWEDKYPEANIAIVCGMLSGLVVVDVDDEEGQRYCKQKGIRSPIVSKTGKGYHVFFRHPGGIIPNSVKGVPGIDIRSEGGYVVAPPSFHKERKKYYQWHRQDAPWDELPDFEKGWFDFTVNDDETLDLSNVKVPGLDLSECTPGNRNNRLAKNAGFLANKGLDPNTIAHLLWLDNIQNVKPPIGRYEFERTIKSICTKHKREHPEYLEETQENEWENLFNFSQWSCEYMAEETPPEPKFLVKDLIVKEGCAGLLVAAGGTGKGYFSLDLAISLATGKEFFGREVCHTGESLILNTEDSRDEQHRRMHRIMNKHIEKREMEFDEIKEALSKIYIPNISEVKSSHLVPEGDTPMEAYLYAWVDYIRKQGGNPQLVVIDPANKLILADMNDSTNASKLMAILNKFSKKTGVDSLLVTHTNKASQKERVTDPTAVLGSVSFANSARYVISMVPLDPKTAKANEIDKRLAKSYVCTTLAKCNYGAWDQFYLRRGDKDSNQPGVFDLVELREEQESEPATEKIACSQEELIEYMKQFQEANDGEIHKSGFFDFMFYRGVNREHVKTLIEGLILSGDVKETKKGKKKFFQLKINYGITH